MSLFNVGVKLCFIHIKSVVMLFYCNRRCDTFIFKYMFLINIQHTNTHIESSMVVSLPISNIDTDQTVYLQLVTMLILNDLAPTEENTIHRKIIPSHSFFVTTV